MITTLNGKTVDVRLEITENQCIILCVDIELGNGNIITFGNVNIGYPDEKLRYGAIDTELVNYAAYYIGKLFNVFGVTKMKDIIGQPVRVVLQDLLCIGIQNFMDDNKYFVPQEDFNDIDLSALKR